MDIIKAFPLLMIQEGGATITNIAGDSGKLTKFGISKAAHPDIDIANLTEQQANDIYLNDYWMPAHCNQVKPELAYILFSCAVNCGVGSAIKILQRAARVTDDGVFGPATLGASNSISIQDFAIEWNMHYQAIIANDATQQKFAVGWQNRINTIMAWFKEGKLA